MGCGGSKPAAPPVVKSSFLEGAPNDEKELSLVWHEKLHVAAATCKMQGWRRNQEDMAIAHANFNGAPDVVFGGIFDGHSGPSASSFASEHIVPAVVKSAQWKAGDVDGALGFLDTDNALREAATKDGTTAICAVVGDTHLWVANCGDSRAVLCRGGAAVALSTDHKPNVPEERARIRRAGGYVDVFDPAVPRVMAPNCYMAMATSRTLGDFHFKTDKRRPQDEQIVSPRPAVVKMERQDDDQFIILASDGVWDVMSNQNVCDFLLAEWAVAAARHARESMVGALAEALLARCLAKGTMDNCSCVIIDLR
ncbi:phosphatase 2C-like domain-containing protein, partial [Tribonema minus]